MKSMVKGWNWAFIFIFLLIPTYGFGQQEGFTIGEANIGHVYLSLGMTEDSVIEKLKAFVVTLIPKSNSYTIAIKTKDNMGEDLYKSLGTISFTNKRLSFIDKRWYESLNNTQIFELADKLYHLLKQEIGERGEAEAIIRTHSTRDPEKELKTVAIIVGNKRISLLITESEKVEYGHQVAITEDVSDKPFKP
jgi:hypothetical protein